MALPAIVSMLISSFYNMADTYLWGRISTEATAAVGVVFPLMSIIQALGFTFGHGSGNYISRALGHGDVEHARKMATTGFVSAFIAGAVFGVLGLLFLDPLVQILGATPTIAPYARDYALYILIGTPFMASSLVLNNQLRFQGSAFFGMIGMGAGAGDQHRPGPHLHLRAGHGRGRRGAGHDPEPDRQLFPAAARLHAGRQHRHPPAGVCAEPVAV